jgi:uncharacterized protein (TIGR03437 family)
MSAGYQYPAPLYLAPGQMVTLFVAPVSGISFARAPANSDLPTSLGGVHAGMTDRNGPGVPSLTVPILEVRHFQTCLNPNAPACFASPSWAVTVQIPYELRLNSLGTGYASVGVAVENATFNVLSSTDVWVTSDQIHILKALDAVLSITGVDLYGQCSSTAADNNLAPLNFTGLPCPPIVTHSDGSLVTAKNPAKAGEELVAYAVGLGQTSPPFETGKIVKALATTLTTFTMDFNFRPNALATRPPPADAAGMVPQPLYAGATPGYVGLYQINFVVPPVPRGTSPCAEIVGPQAPTANVVYSNLTVSVGGRYSFDGAGICVAVDAAQPSAASIEPEPLRKGRAR